MPRMKLAGVAVGVLLTAGCGTTVPQTTVLGAAQQVGAAGSQGQLQDSSGASDPTAGGAPAGLGATTVNGATVAAGGVSGPAQAGVGQAPVGGPVGVSAQSRPSGSASTPGSHSTRVTTSAATRGPTVTTTGAAAKPGHTSGPASTAAGPANAPGVTATTIEIGYFYATNGGAAEAALGASVNYGDPLASANATVAYINAHGGVAGRMIHLDPYAVDATSTESTAAQEQAACSHFTEDTTVFAVVNVPTAPVRACLGQRGISAIGGSVDQVGTADFAAAPTYVDTQVEIPQDAMLNLSNALAGDGYDSTKWNTATGAPGGALPVKVGIVLPDEPRWTDAVNNVLIPALKQHGINVAANDVYTYQFPASTADDATTISEIQAAVLQFRSDNVTNVIPVEVNALAFFALGANTQNYYPRYGLGTSTQAQLVYTSGVVPAQQLVGAVGFGWDPLIDLPDATSYASPGLTQCEKINNDAGLQLAGSTAIATAAAVCDQLFMVQAGVGKIPSGQPITAVNFATAVGTLGTSFPIAALPSAQFSPTKRYPVTQGWTWSWDTGCTCMRYTGAAFSLA